VRPVLGDLSAVIFVGSAAVCAESIISGEYWQGWISAVVFVVWNAVLEGKRPKG